MSSRRLPRVTDAVTMLTVTPKQFKALREQLDRRKLGFPAHPEGQPGGRGKRRPWPDRWHGLSQIELAERLGVFPLTISKWERGLLKGKQGTGPPRVPELAARLLRSLAGENVRKEGR
jgi:Helix-turn-helix